jgi:peptidyl-prolyl cis-trans isomerase SurA
MRGIMNRNIASIAFLLAAALPLQAQNQGAHPANLSPASTGGNAMLALAKPVARVNGAELTQRDLLREMYAIFPYARQHNGGFPQAMEADIRRGALKMIEFEELVYQEAKRRQMTVAPERLAKSEKQFRAQFANEQQFQDFLQSENGGSLKILRTKILRSLLIEDLLKADVTDKSWISMAEAKAFYATYPERFKLPESYSLQSITIMPPVRPSPKQPTPPPPTPGQLKQMQVRAEDALLQAKATKTYEEFGILAEKISEDDYRVMMGSHKSVDAAELPPAVLQAVSKMEPGQISDLIQAEGSLTIIRLNAHTPARMQQFSEVYSSVRAQMRRNKQEMLRRELDAKLRKNAKVEEL